MSTTVATVAAWIRFERLERGWSQWELSDHAHVRENAISRWETGDRVPEPRNLEKLADAFGVPAPYHLLGESIRLRGRATGPTPASVLPDAGLAA